MRCLEDMKVDLVRLGHGECSKDSLLEARRLPSPGFYIDFFFTRGGRIRARVSRKVEQGLDIGAMGSWV